jgi:hypothetical protein
MLVSEEKLGQAISLLVELVDELNKSTPCLDKSRLYCALAGLAVAGIHCEHEQKVKKAESLKCPSVEIEWEVYQAEDDDKMFCAAVAMRRQSDMLLRASGRDLDDPDFMNSMARCELVLID